MKNPELQINIRKIPVNIFDTWAKDNGNPEMQFKTEFLDFSRRKKPSGKKGERRKNKLPNQIRHDQNAAIAVGTWKQRGTTNRNKE